MKLNNGIVRYTIHCLAWHDRSTSSATHSANALASAAGPLPFGFPGRFSDAPLMEAMAMPETAIPMV